GQVMLPQLLAPRNPPSASAQPYRPSCAATLCTASSEALLASGHADRTTPRAHRCRSPGDISDGPDTSPAPGRALYSERPNKTRFVSCLSQRLSSVSQVFLEGEPARLYLRGRDEFPPHCR